MKNMDFVKCEDKIVPIDNCLVCKERSCGLLPEMFLSVKRTWEYKVKRNTVPITAIITCPLKYYLSLMFPQVWDTKSIRNIAVGKLIHSALSSIEVEGCRNEVKLSKEIIKGVNIVGRADKIDYVNKKIIDYKTGRLFYQHYLDQLLLYAWILGEEFKTVELIFLNSHLKIDKTLTYKVDIFEKRLYNIVKRAENLALALQQNKIETEQLKIRGECQYCNMKKLCKALKYLPLSYREIAHVKK